MCRIPQQPAYEGLHQSNSNSPHTVVDIQCFEHHTARYISITFGVKSVNISSHILSQQKCHQQYRNWFGNHWPVAFHLENSNLNCNFITFQHFANSRSTFMSLLQLPTGRWICHITLTCRKTWKLKHYNTQGPIVNITLSLLIVKSQLSLTTFSTDNTSDLFWKCLVQILVGTTAILRRFCGFLSYSGLT